MRAFLLAAGRGTRISKCIPEIPKCTLDIGGKPLVQRTVEMLLANHIEVTIIVGYKHEVVRQVLKDYPVNIVYNPFFDVTNSIGSLWMAKEFLKAEDTIIANADVFWSQEILDEILQSPYDFTMLADTRRVEDGDYFFDVESVGETNVYSDSHSDFGNSKFGVLKRYGKELERQERNAEYVGIAYLKGGVVPAFLQRLEDLVGTQQHGIWWENVLYSFIYEKDIYVMNVGEHFWSEIDFIEDYHRIIEYVENNE